MDTIKVEIFGKGCKNCDKLEQNVRSVTNEMGVEVVIVKVKDMDEILDRGVFKTPGLALNENLISTGKVLSKKRIRQQMEEL